MHAQRTHFIKDFQDVLYLSISSYYCTSGTAILQSHTWQTTYMYIMCHQNPVRDSTPPSGEEPVYVAIPIRGNGEIGFCPGVMAQWLVHRQIRKITLGSVISRQKVFTYIHIHRCMYIPVFFPQPVAPPAEGKQYGRCTFCNCLMVHPTAAKKVMCPRQTW